MNKEPLKQANFRLPPDLLDDLRKVSEVDDDSQSEIARKAITEKVKRLKTKHKVGDNVAV